MKKILSLLSLLMLAIGSAWAGDVFTYTFNGGKATANVDGFFSHGDKWNFNAKFKDCEYEGVKYSNGLKMEGATKIYFTSTKPSTVTILQSNWSENTITFDGTDLAVADAVACTGGRVYTINDVAAGDHTIGRGSGESGLFLVKVEYADVYSATFTNDANWAAVYAYVWSGDGESKVENLGAWPGTELVAGEGGIYNVTINGAKPEKIIFNDNAGNQTADLEFVDGGSYTSAGRTIVLNDYTVTFKTDGGWTDVYAYTWTGEAKELGEWPGTAMTKVADGEWTITVQAENAPANIIFHNNAGAQTPDWDFEADKTYEYMLNTYTATFTTDAAWEKVYAYAWSGDGDAAVKFVGDYPGQELEAAEGVYTFTIKAFKAPEKILFNAGADADKTPDMAFTDGRAYKWNTTLQPLFALEASEDKIPAGTTVEVKKDGEVVATLTYGVEGGADFAAPTLRPNEEYEAFKVYTGGNGENGSATGGTVYTIKPVYAGTITVGVWLNGDKAFFIQEDGTSLEGFDGMKKTYGSSTAFTFAVKAGSEYKVYCTGSKLGFYGFDYTFTKPEPVYTLVGCFSYTKDGEERATEDAAFFGTAWNPTLAANDMQKQEDGTYTISYTNVEFPAKNGAILYKVVKDHAWANGSWGFGDNNADYQVNDLKSAEKITFIFNPAEKLGNGYNLTCEMEGFVTGISSVESERPAQVIYNLAGQQVKNAKRGLYIINGKKVVK